MYASVAILAALNHAERTGEGQYVDMALLDTIVAFNANQIVSYFCSGRIPIRWGNAHAQVVPYEELVAAGSIAACREKGTLRLEGREYEVKDGDVIEAFTIESIARTL